MSCWDATSRMIFAPILFLTADWPAATKTSGFSGHNNAFPCRFCQRETANKHLVLLSGLSSLRRAMRAHGTSFYWINTECASPRSNTTVKRTWESLNRRFSVSAARLAVISTSSGFKMRPCIADLEIDFIHPVLYDPMHSLFEEIVRTIIEVVF